MGLIFAKLWGFFCNQEHKVIIVGLDNAGKTTILYQFLMNEVVHTSPTIGSNVEEIVVKSTHFLMWDIGGQESLRSSWNTYYSNTELAESLMDAVRRQNKSFARQQFGQTAAAAGSCVRAGRGQSFIILVVDSTDRERTGHLQGGAVQDACPRGSAQGSFLLRPHRRGTLPGLGVDDVQSRTQITHPCCLNCGDGACSHPPSQAVPAQPQPSEAAPVLSLTPTHHGFLQHRYSGTLSNPPHLPPGPDGV
ncbi:hypothetical protein SKAU_G00073210 [Synaphobranchus kaupii]|uniref:ADP-ribosylation factor-like protein 5B n=1 Tax=Synaphobranchus kaupii TaxID=118154 RepID=A0A9Q1JAQ2_SYNKA|nr:hypothetical protein SKAU_G00073210 [Synaphobranchus kaupii]